MPATDPPNASNATPDAATLVRAATPHLEDRLSAYLRDLETLVNLDSGTYDRGDVQRVGAWVRARCAAWGAELAVHDGGMYGDSFAATLAGQGERSVALLAHLDTVFPSGTTAERPFRIEGRRALGPGVCDMKGGILAAIYAIEALRVLGSGSFGRLRLICTSDEEVGAPSSRGFLEEMAVGADAVLVMEAGRENGDIVGQRKGGGSFRLEVRGRSTHAGVEPEKGRSAVLTLSRQVIALSALTDLEAGMTITVGTVSGGTRPNVVPDYAEAGVDVRAHNAADMRRLLDAAEAALARAAIEGTSYIWTPQFFRPPWERNAGTERLIARARALAQILGFDVAAASTGGTSDGNFTAALGIPTLDGLGPVGGLDHGPLEYIELDSIVPRTALLSGLIADVSLS